MATITARSHHHIRQCLYNQILAFTVNANGGKSFQKFGNVLKLVDSLFNLFSFL